MIIDAGRSDKFAEEYSLDSKTFAIVSTRSNPLSLGCVKVKSPNGSINNLNEGWFENDFTRALIEIIDSSPQRLDWTVLGEKLKAKFGASVKLAEKRQEQQIVDGTIYLGTRVF